MTHIMLTVASLTQIMPVGVTLGFLTPSFLADTSLGSLRLCTQLSSERTQPGLPLRKTIPTTRRWICGPSSNSPETGCIESNGTPVPKNPSSNYLSLFAIRKLCYA